MYYILFCKKIYKKSPGFWSGAELLKITITCFYS